MHAPGINLLMSGGYFIHHPASGASAAVALTLPSMTKASLSQHNPRQERRRRASPPFFLLFHQFSPVPDLHLNHLDAQIGFRTFARVQMDAAHDDDDDDDDDDIYIYIYIYRHCTLPSWLSRRIPCGMPSIKLSNCFVRCSEMNIPMLSALYIRVVPSESLFELNES